MTTRTFPVWLLVDLTDDEVLAVHIRKPRPMPYKDEMVYWANKRVPFSSDPEMKQCWHETPVRCVVRQAEVHEA